MPVPTPVTNQIERALGRLTTAFRSQPNVRAILKSLLVGVPELEATLWAVINTRILSNLDVMVAANQDTGDQIDNIGALVGESRQGRTDAEYLPVVKLRIRVNRSHGTPNDIIEVMKLSGLDFRYREAGEGVSTFRVDTYGNTQSAVIIDAVKRARSGGSRGMVAYTDLAHTPLDFSGIRLAAPAVWGETFWADSIGHVDNTTWNSVSEA